MYRDRNSSPQAVSQACSLLEQAYRGFYDDYTKAGFKLNPTSEPLPWIVFDRQRHYRDFAEVADGMNSTSLESYYSARTNQVVLMQVAGGYSGYERHHDYYDSQASGESGVSGMDRQPKDRVSAGSGGGLLDVRRAVHEAAHQLAFNSGLQKRGVMYPLWVSEGLATNFESDRAAKIGVGLDNAPRARQLLRARDSGRLMPLESFVNLVQITAGGPENANDLYAEAWGVFNFLYKTRQADLKRYLEHVAKLEPGARDSETMYNEFTWAFGRVSSLQRPWSEFMNGLRRASGR